MAKPDLSPITGLRQAHAALLADVNRLFAAAGQPSSEEALAELRLQLGATRAHVVEHFRFEEENGYLDAVRDREPRLDHVVLQLADEHRRLLHNLNALIDQAERAMSLRKPLRERVVRWIAQLRNHELHENEVVQDCFNLDVGAED